MILIRKNLYIRKDQDDFLKSLRGSESEHIRKAIDEYIEKVKNLNVATSPSLKKGTNL